MRAILVSVVVACGGIGLTQPTKTNTPTVPKQNPPRPTRVVIPVGRVKDVPPPAAMQTDDVSPATEPSDPTTVVAVVAHLTVEKARQALLDLMETRPEVLECGMDIKQLAVTAVEVQMDNRARWGPFWVDLAERRYGFLHLPTGRPCGNAPRLPWAREGTFELRGDQWVALPPRGVGSWGPGR
jgi:hypothetical protein